MNKLKLHKSHHEFHQFQNNQVSVGKLLEEDQSKCIFFLILLCSYSEPSYMDSHILFSISVGATSFTLTICPNA